MNLALLLSPPPRMREVLMGELCQKVCQETSSVNVREWMLKAVGLPDHPLIFPDAEGYVVESTVTDRLIFRCALRTSPDEYSSTIRVWAIDPDGDILAEGGGVDDDGGEEAWEVLCEVFSDIISRSEA